MVFERLFLIFYPYSFTTGIKNSVGGYWGGSSTSEEYPEREENDIILGTCPLYIL